MSQVNRGRDVLHLMNTKGELGVREAIVKIAEDNTMMHHELTEVRRVLADVIKQVAMQLSTMKEYQGALEKIQKKYYPDNEANPDNPWN